MSLKLFLFSLHLCQALRCLMVYTARLSSVMFRILLHAFVGDLQRRNIEVEKITHIAESVYLITNMHLNIYL